jgi:ABC-type glycerol-3-phosphate transport system permease component
MDIWMLMRPVAASSACSGGSPCRCRVPALIVVLVFEIQASWTDLLKPLIYLQDPNLSATVPLIVLFAFARRQIMDGIASPGGRKG